LIVKLKGLFSWEEESVSCPSSQTPPPMMPTLQVLLQTLGTGSKQRLGLALEWRPLRTGTEAEMMRLRLKMRLMTVLMMLTRMRRMVWTLKEVMKSWKDVEGIE